MNLCQFPQGTAKLKHSSRGLDCATNNDTTTTKT